MKKTDIHLHLQNQKGLMEMSSPVREMVQPTIVVKMVVGQQDNNRFVCKVFYNLCNIAYSTACVNKCRSGFALYKKGIYQFIFTDAPGTRCYFYNVVLRFHYLSLSVFIYILSYKVKYLQLLFCYVKIKKRKI